MMASLQPFVCVCLVLLLGTVVAEDLKPNVDKILAATANNTDGYDRLCYMCDTYGPRLSGSDNLERALDWILATMEGDGLDNVRAQQTMVPRWVRGDEWLTMTSPRSSSMNMLGLGGSIGTPAEGIVGEVFVVRNFTELEQNAARAKGKIVVYNVPFGTYGGTVTYRSSGAARASDVGAIASLTRSITPYSLNTPHTGSMSYGSSTPIPAAAITIEDAEMLQRFQDRGITPIVHLYMEAQTYPDSPSRNVIAELQGSELPDEVVVFGGHIDSWDVGSGAQDDGGGCLLAWESLRVLKSLNLRPRRTIRAVLWTNEENGGAGSKAYFNSLTQAELNNTVFAMESDSGIFMPTELTFEGTEEAKDQLAALASLLAPTQSIRVVFGGAGADVANLASAGVPSAGLQNSEHYEGQNMYFWYHHTRADTPDHIAPSDFQASLGTFASMAYLLADVNTTLPRISV